MHGVIEYSVSEATHGGSKLVEVESNSTEGKHWSTLSDAAFGLLADHISDGLTTPAIVQITARQGTNSTTLRASLEFVTS